MENSKNNDAFKNIIISILIGIIVCLSVAWAYNKFIEKNDTNINGDKNVGEENQQDNNEATDENLEDSSNISLPDNVKNLYIKEIDKVFNENKYFNKNNYRFDLIYFSNDDIFDLVIMPNTYFGGVLHVYIYDNNKVYKLKDNTGYDAFTSGPRGQAPCYYNKEGIMLWSLQSYDGYTTNFGIEKTYYVLNENNVFDTYSYSFTSSNDERLSEKYYYNNQQSDKNKYNSIDDKMKNLECQNFNNISAMTYDEIIEKLK